MISISLKAQAQIDPEDAILRFLGDGKIHNIKQISDSLGVCRPTASKYCNLLVDKNRISKKRLGTSVVYHELEKPCQL
jgi:DNA-binding MarR family transcriptional regulator